VRILAITNLYPNPFHPTRGTFNRQQFAALAARHEVMVISPIAWTDEILARGKGAAALPKSRTLKVEHLEVHYPRYVFTPRVLRGWYGQFFQYSVRRKFDRALKEFQPDVIFAAWAFPDGWAAVELGRRAGLPVVVKVHGSDVLMLPQLPDRQAGTLHALRRADAVIAVSNDLSRRVIELGADPARVSVVYDGVDQSLFHPGPKNESRSRLGIGGDDPIVLFVGNLAPVKGIDILIEACRRLRLNGSRFKCFIVGQGPLKGSLQRQIDDAGLSDSVRLVGPIPHNELPDWYRAARVFVLPSHSEGVPCVLLEAAACQTPAVATRVGGIPEIAHWNRSRLVEPGNASEVAGAIDASLSDQPETAPKISFTRTHDDAALEIESILGRVCPSLQTAARIPA